MRIMSLTSNTVISFRVFILLPRGIFSLPWVGLVTMDIDTGNHCAIALKPYTLPLKHTK